MKHESDFFPILNRREAVKTGLGLLGMSLPEFLQMQNSVQAADSQANAFGRAKSCIVLYCWGGMSHLESWDPKPKAPKEVRGEFHPIETATPGIRISEHMPLLAQQTERLAIVRSMHHTSSAHGMGMYWNMTGHPHPAPAVPLNIPPSRRDWPSLGAMVSQFRQGPKGIPSAVRLPYPLVDNSTLQAGEYGGWLGVKADPIVVRTPRGTEYGGVSRDLGSPVLDLAEGLNRSRLTSRNGLLNRIESSHAGVPAPKSFDHFRRLAMDMLISPKFGEAFELEREPARIHEMYGDHICGQSVLLARRLTEAGVPIVTVCCAAGDLNGAAGDHWDTHGDNFNRLKKTMLPTFDRAASALLTDLAQRGRLDETLVVNLTDFGRTPKINGGSGRDHYPHAFSIAMAGGGIRGGQVYGSSDAIGAFPHNLPTDPADVHATIFHSLGIPPNAELRDELDRPMRLCEGQILPLF